jgi:hypothetical protein
LSAFWGDLEGAFFVWRYMFLGVPLSSAVRYGNAERWLFCVLG